MKWFCITLLFNLVKLLLQKVVDVKFLKFFTQIFSKKDKTLSLPCFRPRSFSILHFDAQKWILNCRINSSFCWLDESFWCRDDPDVTIDTITLKYSHFIDQKPMILTLFDLFTKKDNRPASLVYLLNKKTLFHCTLDTLDSF